MTGFYEPVRVFHIEEAICIVHVRVVNLGKKSIKSVCGMDVCKYSNATLFVTVNIFIINCNLITHFFLVTVTNYSYIYFVIKLRNAVTKKVTNYIVTFYGKRKVMCYVTFELLFKSGQGLLVCF